MNTNLSQRIRSAVRAAINTYRALDRQERRAFAWFRYIAQRVFVDQNDAERWVQHMEQTYRGRMNQIGMYIGTMTAAGITSVAKQIGQYVEEGIRQTGILSEARTIGESLIRSFLQPIAAGGRTIGRTIINQENVRSFFNSPQTTQAREDMRIIRDFDRIGHEIDPASGTIVNGGGNVGGITQQYTQGFQALAAGIGQGMQNSVGTRSPNTTAPTTTTPAPTTTQPTGMEMVLASASGPTAGGQHGETGVDQINYTKFHPYKKTEQVLMPFFRSSNISLGRTATAATALTFRLNSIYDVIHSSAAFNNNTTVTADTSDAANSIETPAMREYWSKVYNYWHVIKCEWRFKFRPHPDSLMKINDSAKFRLFFYEHGAQYPPVSQTLAGQPFIPSYLRKFHPHVRTCEIDNYIIAAEGMGSQIADNWQYMQGVWKPGDIQHEVAEDQFTRVWHKFTEVPPTAEKLTILLQPEDGYGTAIASTTVDYKITYQMEMIYTVQLKDLKTEFEYITQATGVTATTNIAANQTL